MPLTRIAIVAGEASGDILGAGLMAALQQHHPHIQFEGIGGPKMIARGFVSHFPMDRLSVMGIVDPLKRLPELLSIRKNLRLRYTQNPPDIFIGIDSPDFNLTLELAIKKAGVKTVHYVSPSVWAWRQGRVKKIAKAVDLMLTLFPFEAAFYEKHAVKVHCVGHPLADEIPLEDQKAAAREKLGLPQDRPYLAVLPGSRFGEVEKLCPVFLDAATLCQQAMSQLQADASDLGQYTEPLGILIPAANEARFSEIEQYLAQRELNNVHLFLGKSHSVMAAADLVLIASGTSTLEAMLLKRPMVIAYRVAQLTYALIRPFVKTQFIGLPNLLSNKQLVPEFLQTAVTKENLANALLTYWHSKTALSSVLREFELIHRQLKKNASQEAARAILTLWNA